MPRPMMDCSENALVERIIPLLRDRFEHSSCTIEMRREVPVGRVIPDIVILKRQRNTESPALKRPFSASESVILASLRQAGPTRIDILEKRLGLKPRELRGGALKKLRDYGLLEQRPGGMVVQSADWLTSSQVITIEAKLTRWKEALEQAIWHRQYADRSYVLLPSEHATPAMAALEAFRQSGVGLFIAEADRLLEVLSAAPSSPSAASPPVFFLGYTGTL